MLKLVSRLIGLCLVIVSGCSSGTDQRSAPVLDDVPASTVVVSDTPSPTVEQSEMSWSRAPNNEGVFFADDWYTEQFMRSVTSGGPGLVAVGSEVTNLPVGGDGGYRPSGDAAVWTSADGLSWSRVHDWTGALEGPGEQGIEGVSAGGPGLVAVGVVFGEPDHEGLFAAVWTSPDGITWSRVPDDDDVFGDAGMSSVTAGGPGLVAVGGTEDNAAVVWTSPDGITWSRVPDDDAVFGGAQMSSVNAGGPGLVAVGSAGVGSTGVNAVVWTSPDGFTWSRVPDDDAVFGDAQMSSVTAGGPGVVAVGYTFDELNDEDDAVVWTSPDGITWSRVPDDAAVFGGAQMSSVTAGDPGVVAGGSAADRAAVWTSPDGISWSRVRDDAVFGGSGFGMPEALIAPIITSVAVGGPGLVAVGEYSRPHPVLNMSESGIGVWIASG